MTLSELLVTEIFYSLQGEGSLAGLPFSFIRLTGCNLRCTYCDSSYAFKGGKKMSITEILECIRPFHTRHVLLTGGEPLLQHNTPELVRLLTEQNYAVSIETHGEISIAPVAPLARIIMDIKTPSSGMCRWGFKQNLKHLKPNDEIKFVIASIEDYKWAREIIKSGAFTTQEILLSPAMPHKHAPGNFEGIAPQRLAERILEDQLPVRFQLQLHKLIWGSERRGV